MKHLSTPLSICLALCLLVFTFASVASASEVPTAAVTGDFIQLQIDGWSETAPGVYQRAVDGRLQILAYGDAGPRLELGWLDAQIALLTASWQEGGSTDVYLTLQELEERREEIAASLRRSVTGRQVGGTDLLQQNVSGFDQVTCDVTQSLSATAGPTSTGPQAAASVSFSDVCGGDADIYCYAFARAYQGTVFDSGTQADGTRTVSGSGSCSVSKAATGDNNCFANSRAQLSFEDSTGTPVQFVEQTSTQYCRPFAVEMDAPEFQSITIPYGQCVTLDFTASSNRSGTTFTWQWQGGAFSTGSTYSKTLCNNYTSGSFDSYVLFLNGLANGESDQAIAQIDVTYSAP